MSQHRIVIAGGALAGGALAGGALAGGALAGGALAGGALAGGALAGGALAGGALAGPTAAARARELDEHAYIVLLEHAPTVSIAIAGLAYHLSGEVK